MESAPDWCLSRQRSWGVGIPVFYCDKCGKESEVPFKPTSSKPIYCRDCFKKEDSREGGRPGSGGSAKEFDEINMKLNKIMKALDIE